jgi:hypothetical protein
VERLKQFGVIAFFGVCIAAIGYTAAQWRTVEVTAREIPDARNECPTCQGTGIEHREETCPKCKGSGRQEWKLGRSGMGNNKPLCTQCAGRRNLQIEEDCSTCDGNGYVLEFATVYDVREGYSIWEQGLQIFGISPPLNPKPYRYPFTGIYPSILKYVEAMSRDGFQGEITKTSAARMRNDVWYVSVVIDYIDAQGTPTEQARRIYFKNRAITGSDRLDQ